VDDYEDLRAYSVERSEEAFRNLVERYSPMVYRTCIRRLREPNLAEDAVQAVFLVLAQKAGTLGEAVVLPVWLARTAKYACLNIKRSRFQEERKIAQLEEGLMESTKTASAPEVENGIEEALDRLGSGKKKAIYLHYFMGKTQAEVAKDLGSTETAVRKKISRALQDLKGYLSRMGLVVPPEAITKLLGEETLVPLPTGLTERTAQLALGHATTGSTATIAKGAMDMMFYAKVKMAALVCAGVLLVGGAGHQVASGFVGESNSVRPSGEKKGEGIPKRPKTESPGVIGTPIYYGEGDHVSGLSLSLSANRFKTVLKKKGIDPVVFIFRIQNHSNKDIRLNVADGLRGGQFRFKVTGPSGKEVNWQSPSWDKSGTRSGSHVLRSGHYMKSSMFKIRAYGLKLPRDHIDKIQGTNLPGKYKVKLIFQMDKKTNLQQNHPNAWTGTLTSNPITITVLPAEKQEFGEAKNGLALGLSADRYETVMKGDGSGTEPVKLKFSFQNVGKNKIKVNKFRFYRSIHLEGSPSNPKDGFVSKPAPQRKGGSGRPRVEHFHVLKNKDTLKLEHSLFLPGELGQKIYSIKKPGTYKFKVIYKSIKPFGWLNDPDYKKLREDTWRGTITSNEIEIVVKGAEKTRVKVGTTWQLPVTKGPFPATLAQRMVTNAKDWKKTWAYFHPGQVVLQVPAVDFEKQIVLIGGPITLGNSGRIKPRMDGAGNLTVGVIATELKGRGPDKYAFLVYSRKGIKTVHGIPIR